MLQKFEIKLVVGVAAKITWQFGALILLLLLTGQRLREVAGIRWDEIDLAKKEWMIPGTRTKNKRVHLVPLSRQVMTLLKHLRKLTAGDGLILTTTGKTPISGFSKAKLAIDELVARATNRVVADWVMLTTCGERWPRDAPSSRFRSSIPRRCSTTSRAHRGGIAGTYHLYRYAKEKRVALQRWADKVEAICGGIPLVNLK